MKKFIIICLLGVLFINAKSQTIEFYDGFENGTTSWTLTGNWGLTTSSFTGLYALTESPVGNYYDQSTTYAVMDTSIDLSLALDAYVEFTATYSIEFGFDYNYFDVSGDGGQTWINITSFTGDSAWWRYTYSLGGFVGNTDVKCRFRFVTDDLLNYDGMRIDEFKITSYIDDLTPPLIVHNPLPFYEGSLYSHQVIAEIIDISGVGNAILNYSVDNLAQPVVAGTNYNGNTWLFIIPAQDPGAWITYNIWAIDQSINTNNITSPNYEIISGNYIKYDNGIVDFMTTTGVGYNTSAAVKIDIGGTTDLVTALIRNYTDPNNPNADMLFHVWADNSGVPGQDLIVPFDVTPAANPAQPHKMTRIDLRPYSDSLAGINGNVFVGFTAPYGNVHLVQTSPSIGGHTYTEFFSNWSLANDDYHFRAITAEIAGAPVAAFSFDTINDPMVSFTDLSLGTPISWLWDFDDNGITSTIQNPQHAFTLNGAYNVCLTIDNGINTNTTCQIVNVQNAISPEAGFYFITTWSPEILFVDTTLGYPTTWLWDFDDNGATWGYLNPSYTFSENGIFNVCLYVDNAMGSDSVCHEVVIDTYVQPIAAFSYNISSSPWIQFFDESSSQIYNSPDTWLWNFDDNGQTSIMEDPLFLFSGNGIYNVCLTSSNQYGSDTYCNQVLIDSYIAPTAAFSFDTIDSPQVHFFDNSTDSVINSASMWIWDFGDGTTSTQQDPSHTFAMNGTYVVCLIASNAQGSDTICDTVSVNMYTIPQAAFLYDSAADPIVFFQDASGGVPTNWYWDFDDNGASSIVQNPALTFSTNDTFYVCLTVNNYLGGDTYCTNVIISSYLPPVSGFTYTVENDSIVHFIDNSDNEPDEWLWDFGYNSESSNLENPDFIYPNNGIYHVCLTTSNVIGPGDTFCDDIDIVITGIPETNANMLMEIFPQPMVDYVRISHPYFRDGNILNIGLIDMLGKEIPTIFKVDNSQITILRNELLSGMYILQIETNEGFIRGKLLVE